MDFEKLEVWKRACRISVEIYQTLRELKDFGFKDQITRSSLSVASNISEGMVRPTANDKIRFLHIANGSCAELRTQAYIGITIGYIPEDVGRKWVRETKEISAMLMGLVKKLRD
ncbi:MAG: four helix bundle protein [Desulfuromonas sp.]|uniref:four helix bundle protein n=1 Tax=Desulfuromonas sp. TaxID=892 RepID=UPI000CB42A6C|nr:four helix bundle protein [Desulfuromonas sp.]PLX84438.1 MAG: four helix bundle protein [Desulfuromonas sp.]